MRVAVPRETRSDERRVALVPESVPRLTKAGLEVSVEPAAGRYAAATDGEYRDAGATVAPDAAAGADVLLGVHPPTESQIRGLAPAAITISFLPAADELQLIELVRDTGRTSFAMELIPRISRAQSMDALSSQALAGGYRAAIIAADRLPRFFPLFMTAAGTVPPARVLVLGAGVAGLQAIATARRLGAIVRAYDVREAAAEEVRSLGAEFIELDLPTLEGTGGYAREMAADRARKQQELLTPHVAEADALITTAAVPGRPAPRLVTRDMVERMKPGSVVVDLGAEQGGNVEGSRPGEETEAGGATIIGARNMASQLPVHASRLYSANVVNLLLLMTKDDGGTGVVDPDLSDEILDGCCVVHAGEVHHAPTRELLGEPGEPGEPEEEG